MYIHISNHSILKMSDLKNDGTHRKSAHDLNNHLAVIKLYAQLGLRQEGLSEDLKEGFEIILGELKKIKELRESTDRFRNLLGNLPGMVYRCLNEPGWPMDFVSEGCFPLTGYSPGEIFPGGLQFEDLIHPNDRKMVKEKVEEAVHTGEPFILEYRIITKEGKIKWVWEKGKEMTSRDGKAKWLEGFIMDITESIHAQQALQESQEKYSVVFHSSPYAMIITRLTDGYIIDANHSFEVISGYPPREVIGINTLSINIWADPADRIKVVKDLRDNVRVHNRVYTFRRKDGQIRTGEFSADIISLNNEPFILSSFNDITEHKKIEEEQMKLREQLLQAQKMETVGRLAGGVAHEFNNTLQIIKTYAELSMMTMEENHPVQSYLEQIVNSTRQSSGMVSQLLAFARKQAVNPEVLDLNQVIENMIIVLQRLGGDGITLSWEPGDGLWPIRMDPNQVSQVLVNLMLNARDAIRGKGKITLATRNQNCGGDESNPQQEMDPGDYVMLTVRDNGAGMDNKTLEMIFEPFFTTKDKFKGTGLGLSTVYGIVKQNRGFITVESKKGKGTVFSLFFPKHGASGGH